NRVLRFVEERIYPLEPELDRADRPRRKKLMADLMQQAKEAGLWALVHSVEIGGQGLPFLDYVDVTEVIGRSFYAMHALVTLSLQDSLVLHRHARQSWKQRYLHRLVNGDTVPGFAMPEPDVASSDTTQLQTTAVL